jgi:hypothetical protein
VLAGTFLENGDDSSPVAMLRVHDYRVSLGLIGRVGCVAENLHADLKQLIGVPENRRKIGLEVGAKLDL